MTQLMREAMETLTGLLSKASPHDPHKGRSNEGRWVTINASREQVEQARSTLSHLTEELRRQEGSDKWAMLASTGHLSQEVADSARVVAAATQALHTDQAGSEGVIEMPSLYEAAKRNAGMGGSSRAVPCDDCEHPTLCADFPDQWRTCGVEADRGGEHGVQDEAQALDLLDKLFTAYLDSVDVPEDQKEQAGHLGHAMKLDDETFYACANLLNRTRPQDRGGER